MARQIVLAALLVAATAAVAAAAGKHLYGRAPYHSAAPDPH